MNEITYYFYASENLRLLKCQFSQFDEKQSQFKNPANIVVNISYYLAMSLLDLNILSIPHMYI